MGSLDNGVSFFTKDAVVGNQTGTESSVFVSGNNSKWSCTFGQQLLIGSHMPPEISVGKDTDQFSFSVDNAQAA